MASWQAKQRDPLFDQNTQAALERRGKELAGAGLVVLAVLIAMLLSSWSPDDPSFFLSATDEPAQPLVAGLRHHDAHAAHDRRSRQQRGAGARRQCGGQTVVAERCERQQSLGTLEGG